jgi:hypothetical protein
VDDWDHYEPSSLILSSDTDGAPQLSPAHNAALAKFKRPPAELPMVDLETPDEIVQDVVSDCSVIAALGVCAEHRQRFGTCVCALFKPNLLAIDTILIAGTLLYISTKRAKHTI